ncbi:MAG: PilZ domain-containing protein [Treponema sp.]|jgi:hypothetical protein|nr:PilZ domain-containing protein [Treponema sp.]
MATTIKRIEKDFYLKALYDEQSPVIYLRNHKEYSLVLTEPAKAELRFKASEPIKGLWPRRKIDLMFDFRGRVIMFSVEILSIKDDIITTISPDVLYKDLERSYSRVSGPVDLQAQFSFLGEHYALTYPRISDQKEPEDMSDVMKRMDPKNLSGLIAQLSAWVKGFTNGYKLVLFKELKPTTTEERIIAETGKILYLPSTMGEFPAVDPFPKGLIITSEMFRRYLESTNFDKEPLDVTMKNFLKQKVEAKIYAEVYVPILFHEYVIGYIHSWCSYQDKQPYSYQILETFHQFASVLAFSFKENGYFEEGRLENNPLEGKLIDISVSGLLFACPHGIPTEALIQSTELAVKLITPEQTINVTLKVIRHYKDSSLTYFGCTFQNLSKEDMAFLFQFLYGRPLTATDISFFSGQV